jgi:hypothetical protein
MMFDNYRKIPAIVACGPECHRACGPPKRERNGHGSVRQRGSAYGALRRSRRHGLMRGSVPLVAARSITAGYMLE